MSTKNVPPVHIGFSPVSPVGQPVPNCLPITRLLFPFPPLNKNLTVTTLPQQQSVYAFRTVPGRDPHQPSLPLLRLLLLQLPIRVHLLRLPHLIQMPVTGKRESMRKIQKRQTHQMIKAEFEKTNVFQSFYYIFKIIFFKINIFI